MEVLDTNWKKNLAKGDIINIDLGEHPETKGHEQAKARPCIVIQAFNKLELATVIPFTRTQPKNPLFTTVKISAGGVSGLKEDSYALCHQIRTVAIERITGKIGQLDSTSMFKIHTVLIDMLEL